MSGQEIFFTVLTVTVVLCLLFHNERWLSAFVETAALLLVFGVMGLATALYFI